MFYKNKTDNSIYFLKFVDEFKNVISLYFEKGSDY